MEEEINIPENISFITLNNVVYATVPKKFWEKLGITEKTKGKAILKQNKKKQIYMAAWVVDNEIQSV